MSYENWKKKWPVLSTGGLSSGVVLDCELEFFEQAGQKKGRCTKGNACGWATAVNLVYNSGEDYAEGQVSVAGKPVLFHLTRYLPAARDAPPVILAKAVPEEPGANEQVGAFTAEEGAG